MSYIDLLYFSRLTKMFMEEDFHLACLVKERVMSLRECFLGFL